MALRKIVFGCGAFPVEGWENHDVDVDLTQPLPYESGSVDFIFSEHCLEHLSQQDAWNYLEECVRVLKPSGVVRTTFPSIVKIRSTNNGAYRNFAAGFGNPDKWMIKHVLFCHGHKSLWTPESLIAVLEAIGFRAKETPLYESEYEELRNIEQHWKSVGREVNDSESVSVEGMKP